MRPADVESTARGAAMLAGLAVGLWDRAALTRRGGDELRVLPAGDPTRLRQLRAGWERAVQAARAFAATT